MKIEHLAPLTVRGVTYTWDDIYRVVSSFYQQVRTDSMLRIPFQSVEDWPHHIENLTHFWWIRFGGSPYLDVRYDPVGKHFESGFNEYFLERWLELFQTVLKSKLSQLQADLWTELVQGMGEALSRNNDLMLLHAKNKRE